MPTVKLTARTVETFKSPATGRVELWDATLPGFGLRITDKGARSWVLMYRPVKAGPKRRLTLGSFPALSLADARDLARKALDKAERGEDPSPPPAPTERRPDTVRSVAESYIDRYAKRNVRRWAEVERLFNLYLLPPLGDRYVTSITRRDVRDLIDGVIDAGKPVQANRVQAAIHALFAWAVDREIIESNPVAGLKRPTREEARDRVLADDEIAAVWKATDALGYPAGPLFKLLFLTAARRDEVRCARWAEIDLGKAVWVLPAERSKNRTAHTIPLTPSAVEVLKSLPRFKDGDHVFTTNGGRTAYVNLQKPKKSIDKACGVADWTIHDIRRTAATGMGRLSVPGETIARVLNHTERAIAGVTSRYARADHTVAKRAALEVWEGHIKSLATAAPHAPAEEVHA